jgi:hypothetical protein
VKNHPVAVRDHFAGFNSTDQPDRIDDAQLVECVNAICDYTGRIGKPGGFYPVTLASALGITSPLGNQRVWTLERTRGKDGNQRAVGIVGSTMLRSVQNSIAVPWELVTFPDSIRAPELNQAGSVVFRSRYAYHSNLDDIPFRVKMEEDDGSPASLEAEPLGLRPPLHPPFVSLAAATVGDLFGPGTCTAFVCTFVYGDRGESGPSPRMGLQLLSTESYDSFGLKDIPIGPTGCTSRKIYRTKIGAGKVTGNSGGGNVLQAYNPLHEEYFFLAEIADNTTTTLTVGKTGTSSGEDSTLDYTQREPPFRPYPPRAAYMVQHLDRLVWANLREHPWVLHAQIDTSLATLTSLTVTIDNTGDGTITFTSNLGSQTIPSYKTLTLREIVSGYSAPDFSYNYSGVAYGGGTLYYLLRVAPGVDWERRYVFREVTAADLSTEDVPFAFEAIDEPGTAVEGAERYPNRWAFSDITFPEEINVFNQTELSKDDAYPIHGLFLSDFTLGAMTQNDIWLITGSFGVGADFLPDIAVNRTQSEHGNFCTRPDSICSSPYGIFFIAQDGLRRFTGQTSERAGREIDHTLMARIRTEPRARDNVAMHYESGVLRIAFPGEEVV